MACVNYAVLYKSINKVYFQINMYKNEQKVHFTVIHVQGNHVHLKEHITCKNQIHKLTGKRWKLK